MPMLIGIILASVWLFVVLYWWSEGIIEASEGLLLACVFCGLIFGLFAARTTLHFLLAFIPLAVSAAYAVYSYKIGGIRSFYRRRCREYMCAIQADPRNLGARQYLAETLYNLGELDQAISEMQAAVDMGAGIECQHRLSKWTKERYFRDTTNPVCRWCETENQPGARMCRRCGSDLPYENALSRWLMGGKTSTLRYYLILVGGIALVCISLLLLPLKYAFIPLGLCVFALAGWFLLSSARS